MVYGLSPEAAAAQALTCLERTELPPAEHAANPRDTGEYAEALRDWIEDVQPAPRKRPHLRICRSPVD